MPAFWNSWALWEKLVFVSGERGFTRYISTLIQSSSLWPPPLYYSLIVVKFPPSMLMSLGRCHHPRLCQASLEPMASSQIRCNCSYKSNAQAKHAALSERQEG